MGRMLEGVVIIKRDPGNYRQHLIYPHLEFPCGVQNTRSAGRPPTCPLDLFKGVPFIAATRGSWKSSAI